MIDLHRLTSWLPPAAERPAFTCRAGCKERDVSKNRHAGPVKCNALVRRLNSENATCRRGSQVDSSIVTT